MLRDMLGPDVQIQPFVHIPWPGQDSWQILPTQMRNAILEGLLSSDRIGFQTEKDAFNFVQTCRFYLKGAHAHGSRNSIVYKERKVGAVTYPISIDVEKMAMLTESNEVHLLRAQLINFISGRKLILRTDRIEPSKNILRGLEAFRILLEDHPEYHGDIQMLALLVPSRLEVIEYRDYLQEIMAEAGMINAEYSDSFWEPVRIIVGDNYNRAIAAMELYDVLLVNPLADGMNLVAKEGPVANQNDGVLVLSENAGAFYELGDDALTVSPFDVYGTADAIHKALSMPADERKKRADSLRNTIQKADIKRWFKDQIQDALREMNSSSQPKKASTSKGSEANKSA
jgi:trehalose 6-phosphate synthase